MGRCCDKADPAACRWEMRHRAAPSVTLPGRLLAEASEWSDNCLLSMNIPRKFRSQLDHTRIIYQYEVGQLLVVSPNQVYGMLTMLSGDGPYKR